MIRFIDRRLAVIGWLSLLLVCAPARIASAEVRSIQDFMVFKDKWGDFVLTEYVWQLEGRYGLISDGNLTFTNCPLPFRITPEQANARGNSGVVEVTGKIIQGEKGLVFQVEKLVPRPRDTERVKTLRFGIDSEKASQWHSVAEWARGRGTFYNDKELLNAAHDLDRNGILTELRQLQPTDEAGFAALMVKARDKKMDAELLQQMMHDSLQARYLNVRAKKFSDAQFRDLQLQVQNELPGAATPLAEMPTELNTRYFEDPKSVFAAAPPEQRQVLARLFVVELLSQRILNVARPDGSNAFEIMDRLQSEVPERRDLIEKYRELAIAWGQQKVDVFTRAQLDEFTNRLEKLGQKELSEAVKRKWLTARDPFYRQDGARGLADLAQQWMSLLKDEPAAAALYIDALKENPQYTPATEWLTAHGYRQVGETWLLEAEVAAMPLSPREQAIREGRVETGMTASQVQAALGTVPSSVTRLASRNQVTEWWTYREAGVVIQLVKVTRAPESTVTRVEKLQSP
ncbi:hypothetical protein SH661x_003903 [Planctomicrobium sp. SH661]|uniref:hypothetical protein n=1 Tax=Planctomicrobium sp. SH661 TaxID=3448124 RepID=UPI003F5C26DD